ncbi:Glu/Leu/Phe/Val dehydrogenase dimerization domain-containing protein [Ningiella sp. W23]|uniref:Glu/Leu/Phe/Val dehydrogenase dimerization domain-containing protein n=1 Tax=Ningiella sp. W23 TaxID=3023715 RepID=UPI0037568A02
MPLFEHAEFDNHEHVLFCHDESTGLKAIIAVHNTRLGPSLGGCRMWPYENSFEALTDVLRLSKGMTYKAAMAGLPQGGGKAVIIGNPRADKTPELMRAMGRSVNALNGQYLIAEDSGMTVQDIRFAAETTDYVAGISAQFSYDSDLNQAKQTRPNEADGNPAPSTAYGVFTGIKAAVLHVKGEDLTGKTVAIQGLGQVGLRLARLLHAAGAHLVVADIFDTNLAIAQDELNANVVSPREIHAVKADVFAPCALGGTLNSNTLADISAGIIAGAANNQLASAAIADELTRLNKTYVPDYVLNAGGIIDIHHQRINSSAKQLREHLQSIGETVTEILSEAQKTGHSSEYVANSLAEEKFK